MSESFYAICRADGTAIWGEYGWLVTSGPDDWSVIQDDHDGEPTEYEIVRMHVEPIAKRTFPRCSDDDCEEVAEFWGLCKPHAVEDDPDAFAAEVSA